MVAYDRSKYGNKSYLWIFRSSGLQAERTLWDHEASVACRLSSVCRLSTSYLKCFFSLNSSSKLVHLFISLPNPPEAILSELSTLFFQFVWQGGPDKIKRQILVKPFNEGGLQMPNLEQFTNSMKIKWIIRYFKTAQKWQNSLDNATQSLPMTWYTGSAYIEKNIHKVENPFWKDVLMAWKEFIDNKRIIWGKSYCSHYGTMQNRNFCIPSWAKRKIHLINDIIQSI